MENIKQYLEEDSSKMSQAALGMVNHLQGKINDWGRTGAFKKSYVETLISEEKTKIAKEYRKMQQVEALELRERISQSKNTWMANREKNANGYILSQQDINFKTSLLTDAEVTARLAPLIDNRLPVEERISDFKDYQEVRALHQRLVQGADKGAAPGKGNPMTGMLPEFREAVAKIEPFMFEMPETAIMDRMATDLDNSPYGQIVAERKGEKMFIPIDQLIDDKAPLAQLI